MALSVVAAASQKGTTTNLSVTKPTGTADKDKLIGFQATDAGTYSQLTAPAGFNLLTGLDKGTDALHFKLWEKTAASEGSSYSFGNGNGNDGIIILVAVRGADLNTAHWFYNTPAWTANSTSRVADSLTGAQPGALLLCSAVVDMNNTAATYTPPSGMTEQADVQSNTWTAMSVASLLAPPDPTGTKTFTVSSSAFFGSTGGIQSSLIIPAATNAANFFALHG